MEWVKSPPSPDAASTVEVRVLYADTDRMGVVYHGSYFRWFEAGRAGFMRRRGKPYLEIEASGFYLPIVEAHAEYLVPAKYDDLIGVEAWISSIGRAQLQFAYRLWRDNEELVRGYTRHAVVNDAGRPVRLPEPIREALERPENSSSQ